jgi:hypothetical protein
MLFIQLLLNFSLLISGPLAVASDNITIVVSSRMTAQILMTVQAVYPSRRLLIQS